jgi:hypothetical protein
MCEWYPGVMCACVCTAVGDVCVLQSENIEREIPIEDKQISLLLANGN